MSNRKTVAHYVAWTTLVRGTPDKNLNRDTKLAKYVKKRDTKKFYEEHGGMNYQDPDKDTRNILEETKQRMKQRALMARLELMLLDYTFNEDDGKISWSERRALKKHFNTYKNKITDKDINVLQEIQVTSISDIQGFIIKEKFDMLQINKALYTLKKICKKSEQYNQIIKSIESYITNSVDYI